VQRTCSYTSEAGDLLVEVLGQPVDLLLVGVAVLPELDLGEVWLVKLLDMTNDGWPVAQPRFTRRPSDSRMMRGRREVNLSTCGLMFTA
jgi:hypothetical protein